MRHFRFAARQACVIGPARLDHHKFFVGIDGWGAVTRKPGDSLAVDAVILEFE